MGEVRDRTDSVEQLQVAGGGGEAPPRLWTTFSQGGNDREDLILLLKALESLLGYITRNPQDIVPDSLHEYLRPAWDRVQPRFQHAIDRLADVTDMQLEDAGLSGTEFQMKFEGVRQSLSWIRDAILHVPGSGTVAAAVSIGLGFMDVAADSIPVIGAVLHPIKEYKEFVAASADAVTFAVQPTT